MANAYLLFFTLSLITFSSFSSEYIRADFPFHYSKEFARDFHLDEWEDLGLNKQDFASTLENIGDLQGAHKVDITNLDKPGYWTYEFFKSAERIEMLAHETRLPRTYKRASALYFIAGYPKFDSPHELHSLNKAVDLHVKAGLILGEDVSKVTMTKRNGREVIGLLYFPKIKTGEHKIPAVMLTGGPTHTLLEHHRITRRLLKNGYAVLVFDTPGSGLDYRGYLEEGLEGTSHEAALDFLLSLKGIDENRIGTVNIHDSTNSQVEFISKGNEVRLAVSVCPEEPLKKSFSENRERFYEVNMFGDVLMWKPFSDLHDIAVAHTKSNVFYAVKTNDCSKNEFDSSVLNFITRNL